MNMYQSPVIRFLYLIFGKITYFRLPFLIVKTFNYSMPQAFFARASAKSLYLSPECPLTLQKEM